MVAFHNDPSFRLCMIASGSVSVIGKNKETSKLVATLRAGDHFGEYSLLGDRQCDVTISPPPF